MGVLDKRESLLSLRICSELLPILEMKIAWIVDIPEGKVDIIILRMKGLLSHRSLAFCIQKIGNLVVTVSFCPLAGFSCQTRHMQSS